MNTSPRLNLNFHTPDYNTLGDASLGDSDEGFRSDGYGRVWTLSESDGMRLVEEREYDQEEL